MQVHRNRIPFLKQFRKEALGTRKKEITADKVNKTTQVFTFAKKKSQKKTMTEELKIVKIGLAAIASRRGKSAKQRRVSER
jgi:hypothetical protein